MTETKQVSVTNWHYNTHEVVLRLPQAVGEVYENGRIANDPRCYKLGPLTMFPATSEFDGNHMGDHSQRPIHLAKDEKGNYCLVRASRYEILGSIKELRKQGLA